MWRFQVPDSSHNQALSTGAGHDLRTPAASVRISTTSAAERSGSSFAQRPQNPASVTARAIVTGRSPQRGGQGWMLSFQPGPTSASSSSSSSLPSHLQRTQGPDIRYLRFRHGKQPGSPQPLNGPLQLVGGQVGDAGPPPPHAAQRAPPPGTTRPARTRGARWSPTAPGSTAPTASPATPAGSPQGGPAGAACEDATSRVRARHPRYDDPLKEQGNAACTTRTGSRHPQRSAQERQPRRRVVRARPDRLGHHVRVEDDHGAKVGGSRMGPRSGSGSSTPPSGSM